MHTRILQVDAKQPDPGAIAIAAEILQNGGLVAFPTETVYGLGANALDRDAVALIFTAKGRPANNPVIVHVCEKYQARSLVKDWPDKATQLTDQFWPGPLTIVLPRTSSVPDAVTAGGPTIAIRMPAHPVALALLRAAKVPVAAPSANRSTYLSPTQAAHVLDGLEGRIDLVLDSGPTSGGIESTVLDLTTSPPRILRPGLISASQLESVIGVVSMPFYGSLDAEDKAPRSPGMMKRHYAPRAQLECVTDNSWRIVQSHLEAGHQVGWMTLGPSRSTPHPRLRHVEMPSDPTSYAAQLYSTLHSLDHAGVQRIIADLPPDTPEWLAVRDRLQRAAARNG